MVKIVQRRSDVYIDDGYTREGNIGAPAPAPPPIPPVSPYFLDTFTGPAGPLGPHISDSGHTWEEMNNLFFPSDGDALNQNYLTGGGVLGCHDNDYYPVAPTVLLTLSDATQEIEIDFSYSTDAGPYMGFLSTQGGPSYVMNWFVDPDEGNVWIDVYVEDSAGINDDLGSIEFDYQAGFLHTMKIVIVGEKKTIFVDGVQKLVFYDRRATVGAPWIALNDCVAWDEDDNTYPIFTVSRVKVTTPEVVIEPPPVGGASFTDTFTGVDGTLLRNHVPDSGGVWLRDSYTESDGYDSQLIGGLVLMSGASDYTEHYTALESGQNYTIKLMLTMPSASPVSGRTDCQIFIVGGPSYNNWDPVAISLGAAHSFSTTPEVVVFFNVNRGNTFSWESAYLGARLGQTMSLELKVAGVNLELKLDGVVLTTTTLASPPSTGHWVGMYQDGAANSPTKWIKVDKLEVITS